MKCNGCDQEMTDNVACSVEDYDDFADGNARARIPNDGPGNCHDCRTPAGGLHHPGCDAERCPACAGQAISCGCGEAEDEDEDGILHAYGAAGFTGCGLETGGAISRHDGYTGPPRRTTSNDSVVTCPACREDGKQ